MTAYLRAAGRPRRSEETRAALRLAIEGGEFRAAQSLPGERQLAELLHVSRTTLRRALADLIGEGLLVQRQGMGTFITRHTASPEAYGLGPRADVRLGLGETVTAREIGRATALPSPDEAMMLGLGPGEGLLRLSRILLEENVPVAVEHAAAPCGFFADSRFEGSAMASVLSACGFHAVRILQRLRVVSLSGIDADHLAVPAGTLVVSVHETAYLSDGRCCLFKRAFCRADRFDAVFETRLAPAPDSKEG